MKFQPFVLAALACLAFFSCTNTEKDESNEAQNKEDRQDTMAVAKPFMSPENLPFDVPDFGRIDDEDFKPALQKGMEQQIKEVNNIAENSEPPTFENTLVALEKSGQLLDRVTNIFYLLTGANTDSLLQSVQKEIAPKLAAHRDAIYLNKDLFERVKAIYNQRDSLKLEAESDKLAEYYYKEFVKAGANLTGEDKSRLKKLNEEEASLSAKFTNQLLSAAKEGALEVDDKAALAGLPESELQAAATSAKDRDLKNKWLITLQNTTQQPRLRSLEVRDTRKRLFEASWTRAEKGGENDTRSTIKRMEAIRAKKAELLGFPNYAAWKLQDQMAQTPKRVQNFLGKLVPATTDKARKEAADIQSLIDKQNGGFQLQPWDWNFYADQVRKKRYDLDESEIKPYFELYNVLENGVFYAANQLYGLTFKRRKDIPVYNNDMRVYEVYDSDSSEVGLFYCDYFKRDNKSGGAWMSNIVGQSKLLDTKPVIYNVCNFTRPAEGEAALISYDDVSTMFHEFGHALHGFFADQQYPSLSGTSVARDFVEFPSQFNEHWALYPSVLEHYAKHYETGKAMSQELVDKIKKSSTFNQGYALTELLAAASLDMAWHTRAPADSVTNVDDFEKSALKKADLDLKEVPPRYRSSYFLHIWGNGYSAGYYAYLWTEMLDDDAYSWFGENGGLTRANGQRFRDMILSKGNTEDYNKMFMDFRGHKPNIQPMLKDRGLVKR